MEMGKANAERFGSSVVVPEARDGRKFPPAPLR
jgi:hypothetical protein